VRSQELNVRCPIGERPDERQGQHCLVVGLGIFKATERFELRGPVQKLSLDVGGSSGRLRFLWANLCAWPVAKPTSKTAINSPALMTGRPARARR
jgi:hypothetical protein